MKLSILDDLYIDFDEFVYNPFMTVMVEGEKLGMYTVTANMSSSWEETLNEFIDVKMKEQ